tara:strand:+ start:171 stop:431 length:261 start_codon:yes stop_codon:yes gene_type:complete
MVTIQNKNSFKMIEQITKIVIEILEDNGGKLTIEVTKDTQLRDLDLTSFDLATLTVKIEDEFDVDIFEDGIVSTIGEIIEVLEARA